MICYKWLLMEETPRYKLESKHVAMVQDLKRLHSKQHAEMQDAITKDYADQTKTDEELSAWLIKDAELDKRQALQLATL